MAQEHSRPQRREENPDDGAGPAPAPQVAERKDILGDDIDSVLDEIDDVLETNAEEFVRSFVQKGGQ
jgi:ubiquitin-like protein Pup